jgi:hypothetical protein
MAGNINMLKNIIDDTIIKKLQIIFSFVDTSSFQ